MFNWMWKRIFSEKNIEYLMEKAEPYIEERISEIAKETIITTIQDEEVQANLTGLGDALYERYTKKFWGTIGGKQKGINNAMQEINPLSQIMDGEGNFSLAGLIKGFLSGDFQMPNQSQTGTQYTKSSRKVLKYQ